MCTDFIGLFDVCIYYLCQSFHLIIDKTHHIMIMLGQLPLLVCFLVKKSLVHFSKTCPMLHANMLVSNLKIISIKNISYYLE